MCRRRSGELVGAAKEGLLALSVGVGLGVLAELMEEEVDEVVGPKGKHDPDRVAVRHGHEDGEVTLGGRRVPVERPRVRSADGEARCRCATYEHFADRDPLSRVVLERMLAGVSTRRYQRTQEPVGEQVETSARSTSKSRGLATFVERTREALGELMGRHLADMRLAVMMLDGIELKGRTNIVALGITTDGVKIPLGLWEGSNGERDRRDRAALRPGRARPRPRAGAAVRDRRRQGAAQGDPRRLRRGAGAALQPPQGAQRARAPARTRPARRQARLRTAWAETDHDRALDQLHTLAGELDRTHPGAAGSLARARGDAHPHPTRGSPGRSSARSSRRTRASR